MRIGVWSLAHLHAYSYVSALCPARRALVGLADDDAARGARWAHEHGVPFFADADDLLGQVDAVVITSANAIHSAMALRAAERGVAVLPGKAARHHRRRATEIVTAFERHNLTLATAFPARSARRSRPSSSRRGPGGWGGFWRCAPPTGAPCRAGSLSSRSARAAGPSSTRTVHVADLLRRPLTGAEVERVYAQVGHGLFTRSGTTAAS